MSKASQREAKENREKIEQERHSRFLTILRSSLNVFASLYRQDVPNEDAIQAYLVALRHLSPDELVTACSEVVKTAKFFPNPAEILEALRSWRETQFGSTRLDYDEKKLSDAEQLPFKEGMKKLWAQLEEKRAKEPKMRRLTDAEVEARQQSYFGNDKRWTSDMVKWPRTDPYKEKVPCQREPGQE